ncbi:AraC family transcriptional regulator [Marinobacter zhejiangensis]|uniref:AraC-type DNA-binding protein n=1 Tax=Marinobacter zhejiangensis TaxID=488535 RepID=A0A1I4NGJ3_9GAMM|nr:AraC family transcriptional regulator [Marinobacter zhejiangensis]SFM14589.1 AraC-type DNA-binding protein [Marinobacter zhejiangensis]
MTKPEPPNPRKNTLGDISVFYVNALLRAVRHERCSAQPLIDQFNLNERLLSSPDARISIPRYMRLGHAAIKLTGNPALGLAMGSLSRPVDIGLAGLAALTSETIGDALEAIVRYFPLTSRNSRGQPHMAAGSSQAHFYSIRPYNAFNFFVVDSVLSTWVQLIRELSGHHHVVERVSIEYPSQGLEELFTQWFDCQVAFSAGENGIQLAEGVRALPSLSAQPALNRLLLSDCELRLKRLRSGWTLREQVKDKVTPMLEQSAPSLESVAQEFGLSPWTLQRKLAEEGTGYRQLIDETRKELAEDYIRETVLSLSEVSWLLGFSTPAAFHKAYRRWFNVSPGEHRKTLRAQDYG